MKWWRDILSLRVISRRVDQSGGSSVRNDDLLPSFHRRNSTIPPIKELHASANEIKVQTNEKQTHCLVKSAWLSVIIIRIIIIILI